MLFCIIFAAIVVAPNPDKPPAAPEEGEIAHDFPKTTPTKAVNENPVKGYWAARARTVAKPDALNWVLDASTKAKQKDILEYPLGYDGMAKDMVLASDKVTGTSDFKLKDLYTIFPVDAKTMQIEELFFALEPMAYKPTADSKVFVGSHGFNADSQQKLHLQYLPADGTECIPCLGSNEGDLDNLPGCISNYVNDFKSLSNTCIQIDLLNRRDCRQMADFHQNFCEGVQGIKPNPTDQSGSGAISAVGIPGNGGCQQYIPGSNPAEYKNPGRDWDTSSTKFSSDNQNYDANIVGKCCGNDKEDVGILKSGLGTIVPNQYACIQNKKNEFVWGKAGDPGFTFVIFSVNRSKEGLQFDAVSNGENWFFCNAASKSMYGSTKNLLESNFKMFTGVTGLYEPNGVVLGEFATLPRPSPSFGAGIVTPPPPGEGPLSESGWGVTPTEGGSSSVTEVVGVDNITSGKGVTETGPLVSTVCDKDGDGYDGAWTTDVSMKNKQVSPDSSAVWIIDTDKNKCDKPSSPFDCNDKNTKVGPGAVEACANGIDDNCNGAVDEVGCVPPEETKAPDIKNDPRTADRFMCFEEQRSKFDEGGTFAECCGFDLGWCLNSIPKARRQGSAIKTLREFSSFGSSTSGKEGANCANTANCALRYGVAVPAKDADDSAEYAVPFFTDNSDAKIRDWRSYKYLEFYVHFTGNFIGNIKIGKFTHPEMGEKAKNNPLAYDYYINEPIIKYVVNEPQLKKWLRVVIPLEKFPPVDQADVVVIASPIKLLKQTSNKITYTALDGQQKTVRTLISIDKIALVGANGNRYCAGTYPPKWTSDLDDLGSSADEPMNILDVPGLAACEDTPGFGWTGSQCCGDDTGKDTSAASFGDSTFREFFSDTNGGCWAGQKIGLDQRLMMVKYRLFIPGSGEKKITRSCKSNSCIYELPFVKSTLVTNDYTNAYDLVLIENDKRIDVSPSAITTSPSAALKAENVPLQVLYAKSGTSAEFYGCNAEPYIFDVKNSVNGKPLLLTDAEHNLSSCAVKSNFFCSHAFGNDLGWSNEPLTSYSAYPVLNVSAKMRSNEKAAYNLISNSGFEEV